MMVALALLSAFVFGGGVVLQQRAAAEVPTEHAARPGLLVRLARRPVWVAGLGADVVGFALQALALHRGSLVVVQPLLTTSLLFTLILDAALYRESIAPVEWAAVLLVLLGLSVFLIAAAPTETSVGRADEEGWLLCLLSVVVVAGAAIVVGLRLGGARRAAAFGLAAGIADAFMAVLAKAFADSFGHGIVGVFRSWTPYALIAGGLVAVLLTSTAYQAGFPTVALPVITVTDPVIGSVIGIVLIGEHLRLGGVRGPLALVAVLIMGTGLVILGRDRRIADRTTPQPSLSEVR